MVYSVARPPPANAGAPAAPAGYCVNNVNNDTNTTPGLR